MRKILHGAAPLLSVIGSSVHLLRKRRSRLRVAGTQSALLPIALIVLTRPADVVAQDAPAIAQGSRIRIEECTPACARTVGTYLGTSGDTLLIQTGAASGPARVPLASAHTIEISRGEKGWGGGWGALIGVVGGGLAGTAIGAAAVGDCYEIECVGFLVGTAIGAVAGGVVGGLLARKSEAWEPVSAAGLRVAVTPHVRGSISLRASISF